MKTPAPETFEGQILALLPSLRRYSRSLTRSDADGEDLLQDCVEKVLARRSQWRGLNLRGWALTIMTNLYRNTRRQTPPSMMVELDSAEDLPSPETAADPLERLRLEEALNGLSEENRAVLISSSSKATPTARWQLSSTFRSAPSCRACRARANGSESA